MDILTTTAPSRIGQTMSSVKNGSTAGQDEAADQPAFEEEMAALRHHTSEEIPSDSKDTPDLAPSDPAEDILADLDGSGDQDSSSPELSAVAVDDAETQDLPQPDFDQTDADDLAPSDLEPVPAHLNSSETEAAAVRSHGNLEAGFALPLVAGTVPRSATQAEQHDAPQHVAKMAQTPPVPPARAGLAATEPAVMAQVKTVLSSNALVRPESAPLAEAGPDATAGSAATGQGDTLDASFLAQGKQAKSGPAEAVLSQLQRSAQGTVSGGQNPAIALAPAEETAASSTSVQGGAPAPVQPGTAAAAPPAAPVGVRTDNGARSDRGERITTEPVSADTATTAEAKSMASTSVNPVAAAPMTGFGLSAPGAIPLFASQAAQTQTAGLDAGLVGPDLVGLETGRSMLGQHGTVPAAAGEPRAVARQIAEALVAARDDGLDLQLSPEELGRVKLSMTQGEGGLLVTVSAERPETLDLLRRHIGLLGAELAASGLGDAAFSFNDPQGGRADGEHADRSSEPALLEPSETSDPVTATSNASRGPIGSGALDIRV